MGPFLAPKRQDHLSSQLLLSPYRLNFKTSRWPGERGLKRHQAPLHPWNSPASSGLEFCQHISANPLYVPFSADEIRLVDYKANSKHPALTCVPSPVVACTGLRFTGWQPFGTSRYINYPSSPDVHLKDIPRSGLSKSSCLGSEEYQLAILNLCLLAETVLCSDLFNAAIEGYIYGELVANRLLPAKHVDLIFGRSPPDSTLRRYVLKSMSGNSQWENLIYLPLVKKYDDFMEDIFNKLSESLYEDGLLVWTDKMIRSFLKPTWEIQDNFHSEAKKVSALETEAQVVAEPEIPSINPIHWTRGPRDKEYIWKHLHCNNWTMSWMQGPRLRY